MSSEKEAVIYKEAFLKIANYKDHLTLPISNFAYKQFVKNTVNHALAQLKDS